MVIAAQANVDYYWKAKKYQICWFDSKAFSVDIRDDLEHFYSITNYYI